MNAVVPLESTAITIAPGIAIVPLIDLQSALEAFEAAADDVAGQVDRANITDATTYQFGSDILSAIQIQLNNLETKRVEVKKPADDYGKMVQKLVTPVDARFKAAKMILSGKMLAWRNAEEARMRAAQEEIRKQQEAEAKKLADAAREKGMDKTADKIEEMMAAAPVAPAPKVGAPNFVGKTQSKRTYWNGEAAQPFTILRAILDGTVPISVIEFNKSSLNKIASDHAARLTQEERDGIPAEGVITVLGIRVTKDEKLV